MEINKKNYKNKKIKQKCQKIYKFPARLDKKNYGAMV
jgi:hypothetical protein